MCTRLYVTEIWRQSVPSKWAGEGEKTPRTIQLVGFNVSLGTLQVISETIFPGNHLTGVKTCSWLVLLVNEIKLQLSYDTKPKQQLQITTNVHKENCRLMLLILVFSCFLKTSQNILTLRCLMMRSGLRQTSYTCVPLSPSSIICYWPRRGDLFGWESNRRPGGK